jgi:hypothetical protein
MRRFVASAFLMAGLAIATLSSAATAPPAHACAQAQSGGVCVLSLTRAR